MKKFLLAASASLALALSSAAAWAGCTLRQSTAQEVPIGQFVDASDGVTAETALTISQGDVLLKKCAAGGDCGAIAQKNDSSACAHDSAGVYECDLDATDTDTVGTLYIYVNESGALTERQVCTVLEESVFDADFASGATGGRVVPTGGITSTSFASGAIDATAIATDAIGALEIAAGAATKINAAILQALGVNVTTIASVTDQTIFTLTAGASIDNAYSYPNWAAYFIDQSDSTQHCFRAIADYVGSSKTVTLRDPPCFEIATSDTVILIPAALAERVDVGWIAGTAVDAELDSRFGAVNSALADVDTKLGSPAGASLAADIANIEGRIPAALVDGRIDASIGEMQTDVMTADAAASDLTTELQSGLATASSIAGLNNLSAEEVWSYVVETAGEGIEAKCMLSAIGSVLFGDFSTSSSTTTFEDVSGEETRVVSTVGSGTRTVTITCPSESP